MKIFRKIKQLFCRHNWILIEHNPEGVGIVIWQRLYRCSKCGKDGKVAESKFVITVPGLKGHTGFKPCSVSNHVSVRGVLPKRAQAKISEVFHAPQEQILKECLSADKKWIKQCF